MEITSKTLQEWHNALLIGNKTKVMRDIAKLLDVGFQTQGLPLDKLVDGKEYMFVAESGVKTALWNKRCTVHNDGGGHWHATLLEKARGYGVGAQFGLLHYSVREIPVASASQED